MGQLDFAFVTSRLDSPTEGSAKQHLSFASNVLNDEGDFCRRWSSWIDTVGGNTPKGVFAYPTAEQVTNVPSTKAISLRALFRVPARPSELDNTEQNVPAGNQAVVGLRAKARSIVGPGHYEQTQTDPPQYTWIPSGYSFFISAGQLYNQLTMNQTTAPNLNVSGSLNTAVAQDTWHRLRMDVIPIEHNGNIIMDNVRYYIGSGATGSVTWTQIGEVFIEATDDNFISWSDETAAHNGFFMCARSTQSVAQASEMFVDSFEIRTSIV